MYLCPIYQNCYKEQHFALKLKTVNQTDVTLFKFALTLYCFRKTAECTMYPKYAFYTKQPQFRVECTNNEVTSPSQYTYNVQCTVILRSSCICNQAYDIHIIRVSNLIVNFT